MAKPGPVLVLSNNPTNPHGGKPPSGPTHRAVAISALFGFLMGAGFATAALVSLEDGSEPVAHHDRETPALHVPAPLPPAP